MAEKDVYFVQMRENGDYVPDSREIKHVYETMHLGMFSGMIGINLESKEQSLPKEHRYF